MSNTLRKYQADGTTAIFESWKADNKNVMYQLCTGGGKTVLFVGIIKKFIAAGKRVVLLAHREELITQAWNHLYKNNILAGIIKADIKPNYDLPCQVASIQTCARRKKLPPADLIIFDEAHHCQDDNSYGNLLIDHYPKARVLGVTATPYRLGGKGFTTIFNQLILGPSFRELIDMGFLCPLEYFLASIPDLTKVSIKGGDYKEDEAEEAMKLAPLVESYTEHCNGMSGVVFAVNVHHSKTIVDQYNDAGIKAAHLDAKTAPEERQGILKAFKEGRIKIVSNVGILTEGFDFPDMQFVQLARPTKSLSLFLQMVGRVTRPDNAAISAATTDEERRVLLAASKKPYGIVLDNAGLYREHGLPDDPIDWERHFIGRDKKVKKIDQIIEMIEFIAEDDDGREIRTKNPLEIEGLKLIRVDRTIREKIVNLISLKEFDRIFEMFKAISNKPGSKMVKPGFTALNSYKDYCRKNNILMNEVVWEYLMKKLAIEPIDLRAKVESELNRNLDAIKLQYMHNEDELMRLTDLLTLQTEKKVEAIKRSAVPLSVVKREMIEYLNHEQDEQTKNILKSSIHQVTDK